MITVENILELEAWIEAGESETDREARLARVREGLFPRDLDATEIERRRGLVEEAKRRREAAPAADEPAPESPALPPPPPPASKIAVEWEGLIPKSSRAYRRGSLHDGTAQEMDEMRSRSRGSPFNAEDAESTKRRR